MKTTFRVLFLLGWIVVVYAVWFYDAACECRKKRKLGTAYEGPVED